ncbi:MAG: helix-turn-helix domain-containing protein [Wenzhouxiangellaceae bacterium]
MKQKSVFKCNCPLARVTEVIGEPWTLMVLREAFLGTRHFNDFERELGIARNILSDRLKKLVDRGLLARVRSESDKRVVEYRLTEAGRDLMPILVGLVQWSGKWLCDGRSPTRFIERETGRELPRIAVRATDGRELRASEVAMVAGPDADADLTARYERAVAAAQSLPN